MTWEQFETDMTEGRDVFWKPQYILIFIAQIIIGLIMRRKKK